ncbi:hypothetical protein VM1G_05262 [Cytospora mali]|uniref:Uncharacterized protein n=1 Tax=Cytospora mali TaxID=578113 RepID=A0A194VZV2_CYTMA|nr:hypothetical protein VM1G_05262 [Valsa mali]
MTWVLQIGLAIESFLNIVGASTFLLFPDWCLSFAISNPAGDVPASAATLWQAYAVLVLALTYPLLACIPNAPGVFHKRKIIFQTLAAGEVGLIGLLLWHATKGEDESGFTQQALLLASVNLVPALTWHGVVAWLWPSLMKETEPGLEARKRI